MCRDNESMTVITEKGPEETVKDSSILYLTKITPPHFYYLVSHESIFNISTRKNYQPFLLQSTVNKTTIGDLSAETNYEITAFLLVTSSKALKKSLQVLESPPARIQTLPSNYSPGNIPRATQGSVRLNKFKELDVDIFWVPVKGKRYFPCFPILSTFLSPESTCLYDIVCYSLNVSKGIIHRRMNVRDIPVVPNILSHPIHNLSFNMHYHVRIYAFNEKDPGREGPVVNFTFQTPPSQDFNLITEDRKWTFNSLGISYFTTHLPDHPHESHFDEMSLFPIVIQDNNWMIISSITGTILIITCLIVWFYRKRIRREFELRGRRIFYVSQLNPPPPLIQNLLNFISEPNRGCHRNADHQHGSNDLLGQRNGSLLGQFEDRECHWPGRLRASAQGSDNHC